MREAYQLIYETDIEVKLVFVNAKTTIIDRLGNEIEITGFRSRMNKSVGEAINWEAADELAFNELWSGAVLDDRLQ